MLKWALIFLVISIAAGVMGFRGVSSAAASASKVLFAIAVVGFLILLVLALLTGELIL